MYYQKVSSEWEMKTFVWKVNHVYLTCVHLAEWAQNSSLIYINFYAPPPPPPQKKKNPKGGRVIV